MPTKPAARHSLTASSLPTGALGYPSNLAPVEPFPSPFTGRVTKQGLQSTAYIDAHGRSEAATEPPRNQDHHPSHDTEPSAPVEVDQAVKKERKKKAPVIVPNIVNIIELPPISAEAVTELDALKRYCAAHNIKGFEYNDTLIRNYCDPNCRLPAIQRMRLDVANSGQICEVAKKSRKSRGRQSVKCLVPDCGVEITGDNVLPKFGDHYWKKHVGFKDPYTCFDVSCGKTFHHAQSRDRHQRDRHSLFLPNSDVVKEQRKQKQNGKKEKGLSDGQLEYPTEYFALEPGPAANDASPSNSRLEAFWDILPSMAIENSHAHSYTSSPRISVAGVDSRAPVGINRFHPYQRQQGHHLPISPGYSTLRHDATPSPQVYHSDRAVSTDHTGDGSLLGHSGVSQEAENSSPNASFYHGMQASAHGGIHMAPQVRGAQDQQRRTNPPPSLLDYKATFLAPEYEHTQLQQSRYHNRYTGSRQLPVVREVHAPQHNLDGQQRYTLAQQGGSHSSNGQGTLSSYQPFWVATVSTHPGQFPNELGVPDERQYHNPGTSSGYIGQNPSTASGVLVAPSGVQSHAQMQPRPNFDPHPVALSANAQGTTVNREVYTGPFTTASFKGISGGTITGLVTGDPTATQPNYYEDKPNYYEDSYSKSTPCQQGRSLLLTICSDNA